MEANAIRRSNERVDVLAGVVRSERCAHRALESVPSENWLRAAISGANGDALLMERRAEILGAYAREHERDDAMFFARRSYDF